MDLNEFPSIFQKVQHSHSRHQKTTPNLLRINLKGKLSFNHSWSNRGSYVQNWKLYGKNFRGNPKNVSFTQFSQNIDGFRQNDSQPWLLELVLKSINKTQLEKIVIVTIYQNYVLALSLT